MMAIIPDIERLMTIRSWSDWVLKIPNFALKILAMCSMSLVQRAWQPNHWKIKSILLKILALRILKFTRLEVGH